MSSEPNNPNWKLETVEQLTLFTVNTGGFFGWVFFLAEYSATPVAADADIISVMACDEYHVQRWAEIRANSVLESLV